MDLLLLPDDILLSYYVSLGSGAGVSLLLFTLQYPLSIAGRWLLEHHWMLMLLLQQVVSVVAIAGTLLVWRGGWGLNRDYLLDSPLDAALAHGLGALGLLLTNTFATVSSLAVGVDADGRRVDGFSYEIHYFKEFWERNRTKLRLQVILTILYKRFDFKIRFPSLCLKGPMHINIPT